MALAERSKFIVARFLGPLAVSVTILFVFFFGGETYQRFGLAALDSTTAVLKNVLGVIGFISLAVLINRFIRYVVFDGLIASATGAPVPRLLSQISSLLIFVIASSACARIVFNQDLTFLWAASGVAGLVLGMALRELLQDVFAGIALNIDRATRIGDYIQIHRSGDERIIGQLMEISWRTTRIKDSLGDMISFPNSKFSAFTITNFNLPEAMSARRVRILLDCSVAPDQATRILQAGALDALIQLQGPGAAVPAIAVDAIKVEGVEYIITYRAAPADLPATMRAIQKSVLVHLARAGLRPAGRSMTLNEPTPAPTARVEGWSEQRLLALGRAIPLFESLPDAELLQLLHRGVTRAVGAGRVAVQAGEAGGEFFILTEGLLEAQVIGKVSSKTPPVLLRPGELFGARTALLGDPHRRTLRARTDVLLLEIGADALSQFLVRSPGSIEILARNLMSIEIATTGLEGDDPFGSMLRQMRHMFPAAAALESSLNRTDQSRTVSLQGSA